MLKAVLFDLDGTVLDTLPDLCACMNEALEQFGCRAITQEETRRFVGNGGLLFATRALPAERRGEAEYFYKNVYCPIHFRCNTDNSRGAWRQWPGCGLPFSFRQSPDLVPEAKGAQPVSSDWHR